MTLTTEQSRIRWYAAPECPFCGKSSEDHETSEFKRINPEVLAAVNLEPLQTRVVDGVTEVKMWRCDKRRIQKGSTDES